MSYQSLRADLHDRLAAQWPSTGPSAVRVLRSHEFALLTEGSEPGRCVVIGDLQLKAQEQRPDGLAARMSVNLEILVSLRNVAEPRHGEPARDELAALVMGVVAALQGYRPPVASGPVRLDSIAPAQVRVGLSSTLVGFETEIVLANPGLAE